MLRDLLLASVSSITFPIAFVNTNAASHLYMCVTPQQFDLDQAGFEALTWVEIKAVGSHGEVGTNTNILTYDTWDTTVIQKGKGISDAGSPEIELARIPTDAGQIALRDAANTNLNYAFKIVRNDPAYIGGVGTIIYNRGLVVGPRRPLGRNEDFDLEIFMLGLNQKEIVVPPGAGGNAPVATVVPVITGTAQVGQTLTSDTGTFTGDATITYAYQWFAGGVAIVAATASTYDLTANEVGKIITVRVTATNDSGSASAYSAPTSAVIA